MLLVEGVPDFWTVTVFPSSSLHWRRLTLLWVSQSRSDMFLHKPDSQHKDCRRRSHSHQASRTHGVHLVGMSSMCSQPMVVICVEGDRSTACAR